MLNYKITILFTGLFTLPLSTNIQAQTCNSNILATTPNSEFTDNGDGTITHSKTGLMWAKCPLGLSGNDCAIGSASTMTWDAALNATQNLSLAGFTDWRLPNKNELASLQEKRCYNPAINSTYFPNTPSNWFWTSSPYKNCVNCSWLVDFGHGSVNSSNRSSYNFVRCVRMGQWLFPFSLTINKLGSGLGTIVSNPAGINCGGSTGSPNDCSENYASGTVVALTAAPAAGSLFAGWGGDADCNDGTVTMDAAKTCTATFNLNITAPTATTGTATNITQTSAKLNGTVISIGATATVSFEIGTTTAYGTNIVATPSTVYSNTAIAVSANVSTPSPLVGEGRDGGVTPSTLSGGRLGWGDKNASFLPPTLTLPHKGGGNKALACGTTYHFRTKATNSAGTGYGVNKTFTTTTCPPPTSYTVTASANPVAGNVAGSFIPETPQTVTAGTTTSFTVTPNEGYTTNSAVTGTCPSGSWNDKVWTTGTINQHCTVIFGFTAVTSWISPPNQTVIPSQNFTLDITVKSTSVKVGQYTFVVTFDPNKLRLDTTYTDGTGLCINGVCPGINALANRFIPVINNDTITLNGNDPIGTGPGNDLQLLVIHFKSRFIYDAPSFTTNVTLHTNLLTTTDGDNIGTGARGATVNVSTGLCGDATGDTLVNIIDALGIARKIVGMPPPPTVDIVLADVNEDGRVAITDALHIARYSVGLVTPPEVCTIGEAF